MRALPSWPNHLWNAPPPNTSLGALDFQHMNLERTQTFRPQQLTSLTNMNLNFFYSLCVLVAHFFLALNNIPLSGCTTVYLSIHSFFKNIFFYLAALDLSCIMWDLPLQHTDSLVVVHGLSSCGMWAELLHGMWDLSSPTRDWTHSSCFAKLILNHWATKQVPPFTYWRISYLLPSFAILDQFSSVAQLCPTLCDPMNCNTPGLPVHHQLPEFTQTHVHRVSDAIQPSHPLPSPSPPAPNPSQHQSLFQWVNSSHEVAKELEFQL